MKNNLYKKWIRFTNFIMRNKNKKTTRKDA